MDIILKPIVTFIQNLDGMSNAILAGGAVRDKMFGLEPRDYDIFVPSKNKHALRDAIDLIRKEFTTTEVKNKSQDYGLRLGTSSRIEGTTLTEVLNFKYKDRDIDIIGVNADDDEEFATKTIETFDYGINMVYDTGRYIDDSHKYFRRDFDSHYMTLYRLNSLDHLPKAMKRFDSFNTRIKETHGYSFYFDSKILRIERPKEEHKDRYTKSKYSLETADTVEWEENGPTISPHTHTLVTTTNASTIPPVPFATTAAGNAFGGIATDTLIQQMQQFQNNLINNN